MKVAILVQGLWRTGEQCWSKTYAGFEAYKSDVYYWSHEPEKADSIRKAIPNVSLAFERDDPQPEHDYGTSLGMGVKTLQIDLRQLADLRGVSQWVRKSGMAYDWIVRTRTDLDMIIMPEPLESLEPDAVYVPCHDNWSVVPGLPGLNDRFAFGPPNLMHSAMERYDRLPEFWNQHHVFHMETFYAWSLSGVPVRRTRTTFGSWRKPDERIAPYYSKRWGDVPIPLEFNRG